MNKPLLEWLLERYPGTPRTRAKQWVAAGRVRVGGVVARRPHEIIPDPGHTFELLGRQAASLDATVAWRIHPKVALLHLDGSLALIDKGSGLLSIPGQTAEYSALGILADFLTGTYKPRVRSAAERSLPASFRRLRPLPVHRLDKFTSGVFCVAMNSAARERLLEDLRALRIRREYVGFVDGRPVEAKGTWRHWLELSADELTQRVVAEARGKGRGPQGAAEAITHYEVLAIYPLESGKIISKVKLRLETGLKHQIRVQAAAVGLPLIGDRTYHPVYRRGDSAEAPVRFARQALHASFIEMDHPERRGERLVCRAELPKDLRQLEASLSAE